MRYVFRVQDRMFPGSYPECVGTSDLTRLHPALYKIVQIMDAVDWVHVNGYNRKEISGYCFCVDYSSHHIEGVHYYFDRELPEEWFVLQEKT